MKKVPFIVLLSIETFFAMISMGLLWSDMQELSYLAAAALFSVVLLPFFLRLRKATDEAKKRKIRLWILLLMLLPILAAIARIVLVIVALLIYFG